ncbi:hypothetical protein BGY98DRAFT_1097499 [Russula aff. rugulosa BPL654]|nr:hypothetical protein BGY98DRAFT_1097499 [Russula aff. rugulosa BPL654]
MRDFVENSVHTFFQTTPSAKLAKTPTVAQHFEVINAEPELYCVLPYIPVRLRLTPPIKCSSAQPGGDPTAESFKKNQTRGSSWFTIPMDSKLDDFRLSKYDWMSAML